MGSVPFVALVHVRDSLRRLDLSNNRIQKVEDPFFAAHRLRLDWLDLAENDLSALGAGAFRNFAALNATSLRGNPLRRVEPGAFESAEDASSSSSPGSLGLRRVDLSGCHLSRLSPGSLRGMEKSLESLDLGANRLSELPEELFANFDLVRDLKLNDNMLSLSPNVTFNGFRYI